jgi:hypothetical protein
VRKKRAALLFTVCALFSVPAGAEEQQRSGSPPLIEPDFKSLRAAPGRGMSDAEAFRVLDVDSDGMIGATEWRERRMVFFYLLDADYDLYLERREVPGMSKEAFDAADLDGDGRLSGFEFNQAAFSQFESADLDHDGVVTFAEFQQYRRSFSGP